MKKSRFTEDQIIGVLCEHEAGMQTADWCRKHGISPATFYRWKAKFGGLKVSEALQRKDAGEPVREIARSFAVGASTISRLTV